MCEHLETLLKRFLGPGVGPESRRLCQAPWWFWWFMCHPGNSTSLWHIFLLRWYKKGQLTTRWFPGWVWWCQGHWCPQLPPEVGLQTALWSHRSHCRPEGESPALWVLWPGERGKGERPYRTALDEGTPLLCFSWPGQAFQNHIWSWVWVFPKPVSHLRCPLWHEGGSGDVLVAQTAVWGVEGQQAKVSGTGLHDRLFSFGSSKDNTQQCRSRTLMEMNPTISGRNTISSPSQLCLPFTSILPFSFHLCRPYFMKIWGEDARGSSGSTTLTRLPSKHQDRKGR